MRPVSSKIWTRVAVSISYDDNHYTTGTSTFFFFNTTLVTNLLTDLDREVWISIWYFQKFKDLFIKIWCTVNKNKIDKISLKKVHECIRSIWKRPTVVEGDLKATFSIATTQRSRRGYCFFSLNCSTYPWSIPYKTEC